MISAWRIAKSAPQNEVFSGEGSRQFGGRWNSIGIPVVYTASHLSLAMLEILVHLRGKGPLPIFFAHPISFGESLVEQIPLSALPAGWDAEPPSMVSQGIGDSWVRNATSAILAVPNAVVPGEINFLLNPSHPRFAEITIGSPTPCRFDPRLTPKT